MIKKKKKISINNLIRSLQNIDNQKKKINIEIYYLLGVFYLLEDKLSSKEQSILQSLLSGLEFDIDIKIILKKDLVSPNFLWLLYVRTNELGFSAFNLISGFNSDDFNFFVYRGVKSNKEYELFVNLINLKKGKLIINNDIKFHFFKGLIYTKQLDFAIDFYPNLIGSTFEKKAYIALLELIINEKFELNQITFEQLNLSKTACEPLFYLINFEKTETFDQKEFEKKLVELEQNKQNYSQEDYQLFLRCYLNVFSRYGEIKFENSAIFFNQSNSQSFFNTEQKLLLGKHFIKTDQFEYFQKIFNIINEPFYKIRLICETINDIENQYRFELIKNLPILVKNCENINDFFTSCIRILEIETMYADSILNELIVLIVERYGELEEMDAINDMSIILSNQLKRNKIDNFYLLQNIIKDDLKEYIFSETIQLLIYSNCDYQVDFMFDKLQSKKIQLRILCLFMAYYENNKWKPKEYVEIFNKLINRYNKKKSNLYFLGETLEMLNYKDLKNTKIYRTIKKNYLTKLNRSIQSMKDCKKYSIQLKNTQNHLIYDFEYDKLKELFSLFIFQ